MAAAGCARERRRDVEMHSKRNGEEGGERWGYMLRMLRMRWRWRMGVKRGLGIVKQNGDVKRMRMRREKWS